MERILPGLLFLAAGIFSPLAQAGELALLINGHAMHLEKSEKPKNEANYGAGIQYDFDSDSNWVWFMYGSWFEDSRQNTSYNVGGGTRRRHMLMPSAGLYLDLGLSGMLMTRETYKNGEPFPAVLPVASIGASAFAVNIAYVPKVDERIIPLIFFQFKYTLE